MCAELAAYGVREDTFEEVIERSMGGSMRFNPVELSAGELGEILARALT